MHRTDRRIGRGFLLAAAAALLLSACGSNGTSTSAAPTESAKPASAAGATPSVVSHSGPPTPFAIPNGTFKTTSTRREELAKGFTNKEIERYYGPDGKLPYTLVLDNGTYHDVVEGDDGLEEVGDMGTYTATDKLWIATSKAPGCPGCVYTYRWSFDGKVLSLKVVSTPGGRTGFREAQLVVAHDYAKVG